MKRCLICCELLEPGAGDYHEKCSRRVFGIPVAPTLAYTWNDLNRLAEGVVQQRVSVPGVQPKLSLHLERGGTRNAARLTLVGLDGDFILKPPTVQYPEMPELEHACMLLAGRMGIETAACGLIVLASGERAFITRRMDRIKERQLHMEDMCQLTDRLTEQKYRGSMEQVGKAVRAFSSNPGFDAIRLFELTVFCFLTGNADMHLKNFSLLYEADGMIHLSPAYDLLPTKLLMPADQEEMALTVHGKKSHLTRRDFEIFGSSLGLTDRQIANAMGRLQRGGMVRRDVVTASFASVGAQERFLALFEERIGRLGPAADPARHARIAPRAGWKSS